MSTYSTGSRGLCQGLSSLHSEDAPIQVRSIAAASNNGWTPSFGSRRFRKLSGCNTTSRTLHDVRRKRKRVLTEGAYVRTSTAASRKGVTDSTSTAVAPLIGSGRDLVQASGSQSQRGLISAAFRVECFSDDQVSQPCGFEDRLSQHPALCFDQEWLNSSRTGLSKKDCAADGVQHSISFTTDCFSQPLVDLKRLFQGASDSFEPDRKGPGGGGTQPTTTGSHGFPGYVTAGPETNLFGYNLDELLDDVVDGRSW